MRQADPAVMLALKHATERLAEVLATTNGNEEQAELAASCLLGAYELLSSAGHDPGAKGFDATKIDEQNIALIRLAAVSIYLLHETPLAESQIYALMDEAVGSIRERPVSDLH